MDRPTLAAYDREAAAFAADWHAQPASADLHDIIRRFFVSGGRTADIGSGSGREVGWLNANGYPAEGFDASEGLLAEARTRYSNASFTRAELPALANIADASFDNVLCETVLMHLDRSDVVPSVRRMRAITKPGGVLYLSWRVTEQADQRDAHGRLYAVVDLATIRALFAADTSLLDEEVVSASSGKVIHRLVVKTAA
ncbi:MULTISPECIES: class I SAM-dependent methyltransferase [unclassified Bradyrhizobium]|uniref:class I SAM-dependent methyltransferase n=1 Tax=unclassified Bradyrhizobium TaxID=2631580 RepID=UPI0029169ACA|nr:MULTISPECIES: class I SAM-dependent methyltransferase [unclassified Bradyrhizobium]